MITIIKLTCNGDIDELGITLDKGEFNLKKFKEILNIENKSKFYKLYSWDLEKNKEMVLFGFDSGDLDNENIHQLPIKENYQYYGDLYVVLLNNNKLAHLDIENFENIYNALYIESDSDDNNSELSDDIFSENNNSEEEDFEIDGYGEEEESMEEEEFEVEEKKLKKKKKIIKIQEPKNILKLEEDVDSLKNETRIKCLDILKTLKNIEVEKLVNLESAIYNYSITKAIELNIVPTWNMLFKKIYINRIRTIYLNLDENSYIKNTRLKERFNSNEFTEKELACMTPQQLFPENWKELLDKKYKKDKVQYETKKEAMTDQFKCRKCKSTKTCYYEMQTRSADEPMTIFITCLDCGNRWKV